MSKPYEDEIWVLDDDSDDHVILEEIFREMKLKFTLKLFVSSEVLMAHLDSIPEAPFMIISDVNLPKIGGFAMRERMLKLPNNKFHSVPFIFWSTHSSQEQIKKAFDLRAHGFFLKGTTVDVWKNTLKKIIDYWTTSLMPTKKEKSDKPLL